jgi:hypothetical protein
MDPNANLAEQDDIVTGRTPGASARLRELRRALAGWLAGGGFAPDWLAHPAAAKYYRAQRAAMCANAEWTAHNAPETRGAIVSVAIGALSVRFVSSHADKLAIAVRIAQSRGGRITAQGQESATLAF